MSDKKRLEFEMWLKTEMPLMHRLAYEASETDSAAAIHHAKSHVLDMLQAWQASRAVIKNKLNGKVSAEDNEEGVKEKSIINQLVIQSRESKKWASLARYYLEQMQQAEHEFDNSQSVIYELASRLEELNRDANRSG